MKKTFIIIFIIAVIIVAGFLIISRGSRNQNPSSSNSGQAQPSAQSNKAPDFSLRDYNGKTVNIADFKGKPLVINSWASWCPFCREELPDFSTVQKELGNKVVIVAIDRQESLSTAKGYTDSQGTTNSLIFLLDPSDSFYQSIGGFSMPETIFVDKNGNVVDHKRGPMDTNEIRERIKKIL